MRRYVIYHTVNGDGSQPIHYSKVDGFYLVLSHMASDMTGHSGDDAVYGVDPVLASENQSANQTISDKPSFTVTHAEDATGFTVSGKYDWKQYIHGRTRQSI